MAPMTRFQSPEGVPTPEVAAYYRRRAEGSVGLIITEGVFVGHPSAGHEATVPRLVPGAAEQGWRRVVNGVHRANGRIAAQLWHLGSLREEHDGVRAWSPSGIRETGQRIGSAMSTADIDTVVDAFATSARVAQRAGFDAVEIHGAHGYLIDEFLWASTNHRRDGYGGTRRHRSRFAVEIVRAVRAATSPDYPILFRFSQFKERDYAARLATTPSELAEVLTPLVEAGVSILHASTRRAWQPAFRGSPLSLAGWAKRLTGLPSIAVGSVGLTPDLIAAPASQPDSLAALAARRSHGEFDLVAVGRPLLADPAWVDAVATGRVADLVAYRKEQENTFW